MRIQSLPLARCFGLAAALLKSTDGWAAQADSPEVSGTFCSQQDLLFAISFDWSLALAGGVAFFVLPLAMSSIPMKFWWWTSPRRRWATIAGAATLLLGGLLVFLPILGTTGTVAPGLALLAFPTVNLQYATGCLDQAFQATPVFFGLMGIPRQAAIAQPFALAVAFTLAGLFWSSIFWGSFLLIRRRRGVQS